MDGISKKTERQDSPKKGLGRNEDLSDPLSNNFISDDIEAKQMRNQIESKKQELERLTYKHAKAQARFLEIMRELSKFREEFNE